MAYIPPVYDRTADDVALRTSKGYFNLEDWNRVYNNAQLVNGILSALNGPIPFTALPDFTITDFPTVTQLNALLSSIEAIRAAAGMPTITGIPSIKHDWVEGSAADAPDYLDANDWERVLDIVFNTIFLVVDYRVFCGVANVGQPRFYQARWRIYSWVPPSDTPARYARTSVARAGVGLTRNNRFRRYG